MSWICMIAALALVGGEPKAKDGKATKEASASEKETRVKGNNLVFNELMDVNHKKVSSSDKQFQGKVVLIDIFGTWCPPCRAAIPHLVDLSKKHKAAGLEVISISFEREADATKRSEMVAEFVKKNSMEYTVLLGGSTKDVKTVFQDQIENFSGFPTLILIGRDGKVDWVDTGFRKEDVEKIEGKIQTLLAAKAPAKASGENKKSGK